MEQTQTKTRQCSFWIGKIFSLVGIIPLGLYVIIHLYHNLNSLYGEQRFNEHLMAGRSLPGIVPIMVLVIWIPIAFHGIVGMFKVTQSRPNLCRFPYFTNLKYILQRCSGVGLLLFIPAHLFKTRLEPMWTGIPLTFHHMVEAMHEPLTLTVYSLGVLGVAFHLANGIWQVAIGWGLVLSERGMQRVQGLSFVVFLILLGMGYLSLWGFLQQVP